MFINKYYNIINMKYYNMFNMTHNIINYLYCEFFLM